MIQQTLKEIAEETAGTTYLDCFRMSNLRRTIISIAPLCIQALLGIVFAASNSTYYMQTAGFSTQLSFKLEIVQQVLWLLGNVMSWFLINRSPGAIKGTVGLTLVYCCWYNVTIGATAYTILCEVSTARLRVKTIAIGSSAQALLNMMWSFVLPYLFNPDTTNLGTKIISLYLWRAIAVLSLVYAWLCFPKTAAWTREKLDEMFIKGVPARKFKTYKPDAE
ncbi:hypothetical protein PoMZ_06945 [Pyricularia oryzae]|uniref:Major facilitator superfamily (MFS) profile domain-containing protein n=1 Tax=Pyricularia oryzae TaxID=318829 RepID=A0A4V1C808_PYROR|nr:hypothetical protein PoMZ_06945 [Pyricularia oryzae]